MSSGGFIPSHDSPSDYSLIHTRTPHAEDRLSLLLQGESQEEGTQNNQDAHDKHARMPNLRSPHARAKRGTYPPKGQGQHIHIREEHSECFCRNELYKPLLEISWVRIQIARRDNILVGCLYRPPPPPPHLNP